MKKILVLLMVVLLGLTGCFEKELDPKTELENASSKMEALESYNSAMTANVKIGGDSLSVNMKISLNADYDVKNKTTHMTMAGEFFGEEVSTSMYTKTLDDKTVVYTQENDEWYYSETPMDENNIEFSMFKDATDIKKVEENKDEAKYQITLSKEEYEKLFEEIGQTDEETSDFSIGNTETFIYIKDGYITKMEINMPLTVTEDSLSMSAEMNMIFEFSKFNEVGTISIPEDIMTNAKQLIDEEKKMELHTYAYDYMYAIILKAPKDGKFTDTTLEYDGPKPTSVNLLIEDYTVKEGTMVIDGYVITIVDGDVDSIEKAE